jgi:hypothetical protein
LKTLQTSPYRARLQTTPAHYGEIVNGLIRKFRSRTVFSASIAKILTLYCPSLLLFFPGALLRPL